MKRLAIILLGPPGCGKGTQANLLSTEYVIPSLSTGEVLRHFISQSQGNELAQKTRALIEHGQLVDDEVVDHIIRERIQHNDCGNGFVFDGFPRTLNQAKRLDMLLKECNRIPDKLVVVNIRLDNDILLKRLSGRFACKNCKHAYNKYFLPPRIDGVCDVCDSREFVHRADDHEEVIRNRIKVYIEETQPLIDFYASYDRFIRIDGIKPVDEIFQDICTKILI